MLEALFKKVDPLLRRSALLGSYVTLDIVDTEGLELWLFLEVNGAL